jgi:hypothetical protein
MELCALAAEEQGHTKLLAITIVNPVTGRFNVMVPLVKPWRQADLSILRHLVNLDNH